MGIFKKKPGIEELEDERDRLVVEEEVTGHQAEIAEKKAIISRLKKEYGPNWRRILGLGSLDLQTLRSVLVKMKTGLAGSGGVLHNPHISPLPPRQLRR